MSTRPTPYPIILPAAPGLYESEKLGDRARLRIADNGNASTVVEREDTSYTHPILNLAAWAIEYGPFRSLTETDPEDPTDREAVGADILPGTEEDLIRREAEEVAA